MLSKWSKEKVHESRTWPSYRILKRIYVEILNVIIIQHCCLNLSWILFNCDSKKKHYVPGIEVFFYCLVFHINQTNHWIRISSGWYTDSNTISVWYYTVNCIDCLMSIMIYKERVIHLTLYIHNLSFM